MRTLTSQSRLAGWAVTSRTRALLNGRAAAVVRLSEQGEAQARSARLRGRVAADTQSTHMAKYDKEAADALR
jgi:hypothetical protein